MSKYEIVLKPTAVKDLDRLRAYDAKIVIEVMEDCLSIEPARESKRRIKRLRGIRNPDYRLRAGEYRAFYSINEAGHQVEVLRIMHKDETKAYYKELTP
jgi:mRNA-degrading endonuclease RelE of RelBE toxin-antitoxin system